MEYYKDLTYYSRLHFEYAKNIGFGAQHFVCGDSEQTTAFFKKAIKYLRFPVNTARGGDMRTELIDGQLYTFGFSEIRVLSNDGTVYAAPDEMIANVMDGSYYPPQEFVNAVLYGPGPESELYQNYLKRYLPEYCWGKPNEYVSDVVFLLDLISGEDLPGLKRALDSRPELLDTVCGGGSLLNEAILRKKEKTAIFLIDRGIDLARFEGIELLTAVEMGMLSLVKKLLDAHVSIKMDRPRTNPLFLAIGKGQNPIAEYLFQTRKDMVQVYTTEYVQNCNILQWTKMCNNPQFMQFLIDQS